MNNIYINTDIHYLRHELFKRFRLSPIGDEWSVCSKSAVLVC